ncbi:hypothetical protein H4R34_003278 [Dimargaris verticillata]|uniref:Magnesium transporter NIPA-domain-containing protein n=1 Tax=Dimargaris verticillata TaxID=2761393 RepID=A0A9W8B149_9FUNG|nr:hypothetical protein H4R34_003278 [Dimargaris verticillata]
MGFLVGMTAAVVGNCVIGIGQCLQKYALNRLATTYELPSSLVRSSKPHAYSSPDFHHTSSDSVTATTPYSTYVSLHDQSAGQVPSESLAMAPARSRPAAFSRMHAPAESPDPDATLVALSEDDQPPSQVSNAASTKPAKSRLQQPRDLFNPNLTPTPTLEYWQQYTVPRYRDRLWVLGVALNYCGELFGNSLALSYLSAAVVTPLGIISVLVNLLAAQRVLGEQLTRSQKMGCAWILIGVLLILAVAPKDAGFRPAPVTTRHPMGPAQQFLTFLAEVHPITLLVGLYMVQAVLMGVAICSHSSLVLDVLIASLFGSVNVMASKVITTYLRLLAASPVSGSASARPDPSAFLSAVPGVTILADFASNLYYTELAPGVPLFAWSTCCMGLVLGASIVGQEVFKQRALSRYPLLQVQPLFFAIFNVAAVLLGLVLFREVHGAWALARFGAFFGLGMFVILQGSRYLQDDAVLRPVKAPHSRALKKMVLFKQK